MLSSFATPTLTKILKAPTKDWPCSSVILFSLFYEKKQDSKFHFPLIIRNWIKKKKKILTGLIVGAWKSQWIKLEPLGPKSIAPNKNLKPCWPKQRTHWCGSKKIHDHHPAQKDAVQLNKGKKRENY